MRLFAICQLKEPAYVFPEVYVSLSSSCRQYLASGVSEYASQVYILLLAFCHDALSGTRSSTPFVSSSNSVWWIQLAFFPTRHP